MKALCALAALLSLSACGGWELPIRLEIDEPHAFVTMTVTPEGGEPQVLLERESVERGDVIEMSALMPEWETPFVINFDHRNTGMDFHMTAHGVAVPTYGALELTYAWEAPDGFTLKPRFEIQDDA
jgi:hypothetical protein